MGSFSSGSFILWSTNLLPLAFVYEIIALLCVCIIVGSCLFSGRFFFFYWIFGSYDCLLDCWIARTGWLGLNIYVKEIMGKLYCSICILKEWNFEFLKFFGHVSSYPSYVYCFLPCLGWICPYIIIEVWNLLISHSHSINTLKIFFFPRAWEAFVRNLLLRKTGF